MSTTGQALTNELRRYFSIGTRTRRYRDGRDMHLAMVEAIQIAATTHGYYTDRTQVPLRPAFGAANAYVKHVRGVRISPTLVYEINSMSAFQFAALLGRIVDAGVTNNGEGEQFFHEMSRQRAA